jgi:hypothetical protein
MKKLNIIRIGSAHGSPGRYIDVAKSPEVASVTWIARKGDRMVENIFEYGCNISCEFSEKFRVLYFEESLRFRIISKLVRWSSLNSILARAVYSPLFLISRFMYLPEISRTLTDTDVDFIWAGNNDSDGITQVLLCYAHQFNVPSIFAYQEHRCCYRMDEAIAFKSSNVLLFSSQRNLDYFAGIYGDDIVKKSFVANEDWRSIALIDEVFRQERVKLSSADKVPRILILARFVTYGSKENKRRGNRVNYLAIIEEILASGAIVHLNCLRIYECLDSKNYIKNNPYENLRKCHPDRFFIDDPYEMENINSYVDMKKFDAGILHNYVIGEQVSQFSQMNTPNRFFEYLVAGVKPIVLKNSLLDVEDTINEIGFGVVAESYSEAVSIIRSSILSNEKVKPLNMYLLSFSRYFEVLSSVINKEFPKIK